MESEFESSNSKMFSSVTVGGSPNSDEALG